MTDPAPEMREQTEKVIATLRRMRDHAEEACLFDASLRYQRIIDVHLERMRSDSH